MSKIIRKASKLLKSAGYTKSKVVKHGFRFYNALGQFVQVGSSPRTEYGCLQTVADDIRRNSKLT